MALSNAPQHLLEDAWYYEELAGINVVVEFRDDSERYLGTRQVLIPWAKVRKSLANKDSQNNSDNEV